MTFRALRCVGKNRYSAAFKSGMYQSGSGTFLFSCDCKADHRRTGLISTGGMDENTLKSLKKKYFLASVMLFIMKHGNYEKMKPKLVKAGMSHIRNESKEEIAYAQDMFETIFKDYKQEKDVHISSLLADLMNQKPVTADDFAQLKGNILLILPDQDFFSGEMQKNLIQLMHNPEIQYVSGGHLSTVLKVDAYVRTIRDFLSKHQGK